MFDMFQCSICSIHSLCSKCSSVTFLIKDVRNHLKAPKSDKKVNLRRLQLACEHKPKIYLRNLLKSSLSFYGARLKLRTCETSFTSEISSCLTSLFTKFREFFRSRTYSIFIYSLMCRSNRTGLTSSVRRRDWRVHVSVDKATTEDGGGQYS